MGCAMWCELCHTSGSTTLFLSGRPPSHSPLDNQSTSSAHHLLRRRYSASNEDRVYSQPIPLLFFFWFPMTGSPSGPVCSLLGEVDVRNDRRNPLRLGRGGRYAL